ncbi:MAG: prepilin-type N-terminal cleavage/methylation domain-containing protein [Deltaproteobacteria bacterium]|nr:prepilin-type N-terminal cleavage/methylation domain-containing protein [Deltaproteobacteria bacterium]
MSATRRRPAPPRAAGFTMIELMMSIVIFSVAATGLMAFEHALMRSSADSNDITSATYVGEFWLEGGRTESLLWNRDAADDLTVDRTPLLAPIAAGIDTADSSTGWIALPAIPPRAAALPLNRYLATCPSGGACDFAEYCVQYRLTVLIPAQVLRMEVRVLWFKEGADHSGLTPTMQLCPAPGMILGVDPDRSRVHVVQLASTLWRNQVRP